MSDVEATVVHVAAGVVGVAFAAPFDAAPAHGRAGVYGSSRLSNVQPLWPPRPIEFESA